VQAAVDRHQLHGRRQSSPVVGSGVVYIGKSADTGDTAVLTYAAAGCGKPSCRSPTTPPYPKRKCRSTPDT